MKETLTYTKQSGSEHYEILKQKAFVCVCVCVAGGRGGGSIALV